MANDRGGQGSRWSVWQSIAGIVGLVMLLGGLVTMADMPQDTEGDFGLEGFEAAGRMELGGTMMLLGGLIVLIVLVAHFTGGKRARPAATPRPAVDLPRATALPGRTEV